MSLFDKLRALVYGPDKRHPLVIQAPTLSGVQVSETTAWNVSQWWAGCRVICDAVMGCHLLVYRRKPRGRERAVEHPLFDLLRYAPTPEHTDVVWKEFLQLNLLVQGDFFAEIQRVGNLPNGTPVALWPIPSQKVQLKRRENGDLFYLVTDDHGGQVQLDPQFMLHVPGLGTGLRGHSILSLARECIGLTRAQELSEAALFGHGTRASFALQAPAGLSDTARENIRKSWGTMYTGPTNQGRTILLEEGVTVQQMTINPHDAELLGLRKFQTEEWARWFNVPIHKLKFLGDSKWANIQQESLSFYQDSIRPWLLKWEAELNRKLFTPAERKTYYAEFLIDAIERADKETRYKSYQTGLTYGWLTHNMIADMENLEAPEKNGDVRFVPTNIQTIERALQEPTAPQLNTPSITTEDNNADGSKVDPDGAKE